MPRSLLSAAHWLMASIAVTALAVFAIGPHLLGYRTFTMLSGSMAGTYPTGSVVFDTRLPTRELRVGDVVTYGIPVLDHHIETHRVVSIRRAPGGWLFRTRGDANRSDDPWTAMVRTRTVWVARADLPLVGYVIAAARQPALLGLARWLVPALVLIWFLLGVWRAPQLTGDPA